jgi:hypothetical protein
LCRRAAALVLPFDQRNKVVDVLLHRPGACVRAPAVRGQTAEPNHHVWRASGMAQVATLLMLVGRRQLSPNSQLVYRWPY